MTPHCEWCPFPGCEADVRTRFAQPALDFGGEAS